MAVAFRRSCGPLPVARPRYNGFDYRHWRPRSGPLGIRPAWCERRERHDLGRGQRIAVAHLDNFRFRNLHPPAWSHHGKSQRHDRHHHLQDEDHPPSPEQGYDRPDGHRERTGTPADGRRHGRPQTRQLPVHRPGHPPPFSPSPQTLTAATTASGPGSKIKYTFLGSTTVLGLNGTASDSTALDPVLPDDDSE